MTIREAIVQQALSLSPEDRVYVADRLEESLAVGEFSSPEIAAAWAGEIERRIQSYDQGALPAVEAHVALERIRSHLAQHRAARRRLEP